MEESATYRTIVRKGREEGREEGRAEEARRLLLLQGETKFGPPEAVEHAAIEALSEVAELEKLGVRLMSVGSWRELLPPPPKRRRNGQRGATS